ncbi:Zn-ribbon domain-containing OB-fold protein [Nocardia sp. NPDC056611]|uniref:Zn-ribbon domain-containing OB-fold protein n=1 Tax=Nocardia sp. NPDC056611 TaxID=3345877 RepID=UPI00366B7598
MSLPIAQHTAGVSDDEDMFAIRRCATCDKLFGPMIGACSACASADLEWVPSSGSGSIVSSRRVHRSGDPHGVSTPLTIAIVELDEGPWVYTSLEGEIPLVSIGPVRVRFQQSRREDGFPVVTVADRPNRLLR